MALRQGQRWAPQGAGVASVDEPGAHSLLWQVAGAEFRGMVVGEVVPAPTIIHKHRLSDPAPELPQPVAVVPTAPGSVVVPAVECTLPKGALGAAAGSAHPSSSSSSRLLLRLAEAGEMAPSVQLPRDEALVAVVHQSSLLQTAAEAVVHTVPLEADQAPHEHPSAQDMALDARPEATLPHLPQTSEVAHLAGDTGVPQLLLRLQAASGLNKVDIRPLRQLALRTEAPTRHPVRPAMGHSRRRIGGPQRLLHTEALLRHNTVPQCNRHLKRRNKKVTPSLGQELMAATTLASSSSHSSSNSSSNHSSSNSCSSRHQRQWATWLPQVARRPTIPTPKLHMHLQTSQHSKRNTLPPHKVASMRLPAWLSRHTE